MVQLNTTYDSSIHQKIFVLKGDEGYARTTDTIATLITDFDNYTTYIERCHVGLEIQVLRELGVSKIYIQIDDEVPWEIPWSDSGMAQIIDEDWNEQGVYWENGKLIIGKYDHDNNINTGLFLLYDVEHTIKVRYDGNKNCLGSSAKPIVFTVPTPDYFATELSFNKATPPRYAPNTTINDITVTLTSDTELSSSKLIDIYDDATTPSTLLTQVELEQDVPSTINLTGLSDGLHKIRASWTGDWECYASDSELDVSVGYKLTNIQYPSFLYTGQEVEVSCYISDYFDEPWSGLSLAIFEKRGSAWYSISSFLYTDSNGYLHFNGVDISSYPYAFYSTSNPRWNSDLMTTEIIEITGISVAFDEPISDRNLSSIGWADASNRITATVMGANNQPIQVADIPLTVEYESFVGTYSWDHVTNSNGTYTGELKTDIARIVTGTVTVTNTQISNTAKWIIPEYWWSSSKNKQVGTCTNQSYVSKVVDGFAFNSGKNTEKQFSFAFNPNSWHSDFPITGIYTIEFERGSAYSYDMSSWSWDCCGFNLSSQSNKGRYYKFICDLINQQVSMIVDGTEKGTHAFTPKSFNMSINNMQVVIDNLVIVREE